MEKVRGLYPREGPCIVVGPVAYHRLALLLFDRTEHIIFPPFTDEDDQFLRQHVTSVSSTGARQASWVRDEQKITISPPDGERISLFCPPHYKAEDGETETDPHFLISLAETPTLNKEALTNSIVAEMREDDASLAKLRRLRAFFHENYAGKELSFVQDDLATRVADYHIAAKKWGLKTVASSFTVAGSDRILSGACAGLLSAIAGMPLAQAVSVGFVATVGATIVKVDRARKHFRATQSQDPMAYIVDLDSRIE